MEYSVQVPKSHYSFTRYFYKGRWMSYWYQASELLGHDDITSILDVGPGTDFLKQTLLLHKPQLIYKTLDVALDLESDIIGSVTDIPLEAAQFDVVCAFQVLEHLEFSDFDQALSELSRVSRKYVFISLPHFGPSVEIDIKIPLLPRLRWAFKIPWPQTHIFAGQHYWEIGKRGFSPAVVRQKISRQFTIKREYVPFENQYHRFYILEKKAHAA